MADGYCAGHRAKPSFVNLHAASGIRQRDGRDGQRGVLAQPAGHHRRAAGAFDDRAGGDARQRRRGASCPSRWSSGAASPPAAQDVPRAITQAIHTATLRPEGTGVRVGALRRLGADATRRGAHLPAERRRRRPVASTPDQLAALIEIARRGAPTRCSSSAPTSTPTGANDDAVASGREAAGAGVDRAVGARCPFPTRHPCFRGVLPAVHRGAVERDWPATT